MFCDDGHHLVTRIKPVRAPRSLRFDDLAITTDSENLGLLPNRGSALEKKDDGRETETRKAAAAGATIWPVSHNQQQARQYKHEAFFATRNFFV
jgi:hypothetical protein